MGTTEEPNTNNATLAAVPPLDLGEGWTEIRTEDTIRVKSPKRKDELVITVVHVQNDEHPSVYNLEYKQGENAYSSYRRRKGSAIVKLPDDVEQKAEELVSTYFAA